MVHTPRKLRVVMKIDSEITIWLQRKLILIIDVDETLLDRPKQFFGIDNIQNQKVPS